MFAPNVALLSPATGKAVHGHFLPKGLESAQFRAMPKADVVGKGLEHLQAGFDKNKQSISASKVVVSL